ncbi:Co2+/Mg2+ efflux protein ApaG [Aurantivibrio plasticivorans]
MNPNIDIQVLAEYREQPSKPDRGRFVFSYTITITNNGDEPAKLISRHWVIRNAREEQKEVKGEGVVGEQPTIQPGSAYTYTSGAVLETEVGTMGGSYLMQRSNGDEFSVTIPTFVLASPMAIH